MTPPYIIADAHAMPHLRHSITPCHLFAIIGLHSDDWADGDIIADDAIITLLRHLPPYITLRCLLLMLTLPFYAAITLCCFR